MQSILRRVYLKCTDLRLFIRNQLNDVFFRLIFEGTDFHCIPEILEIYYEYVFFFQSCFDMLLDKYFFFLFSIFFFSFLNSIIKGFTQPYETEHEQLLFKILLPLHKPPSLTKYFHQLIKCIIAFLNQYPSFIEKYVKGLLRLWPKTSFTKVTLFLSEIARILVIKNEQEVKKVMLTIFNHIAKCLCDESNKVRVDRIKNGINNYLSDSRAHSSFVEKQCGFGGYTSKPRAHHAHCISTRITRIDTSLYEKTNANECLHCFMYFTKNEQSDA